MRSVSVFLLAASLVGPAVAVPCSSAVSSVSNTISWFTGFGDALPDTFTRGDENESKSIYRVLKNDNQFSKLVELVDKVPRIRDMLDGRDRNDKKMTFFAPNNEAIKNHHNWGNSGDEDRKHDMEKILEETLKYHMLPCVVESRQFGQNSTRATELQARDGSFEDAKRRIKFQTSNMLPEKTKLNNYVHVTQCDIRAKNGVIHVIDAPLYVPPDIMDIVYMLPQHLSISATALLKTNLQSNVEFNSGYKRGSGRGHQQPIGHHNDRYGPGSPDTTLFVPTNGAWERLPEDLLFYLFSPRGESTLRKLMAFHTLPDNIVFTEFSRQANHRRSSFGDEDLSFECDKHFDSLIDQKMPVHVKKSKSMLPGSHIYNVELQAHGIYANVIDNPAQNGVFHTVPQVLCPRHKEGENEEQNQKNWNQWRDWLNEWSEDHQVEDSH